MNCCPAIVTVAERELLLLRWATVKTTLPLPVRVVLGLKLNHDAFSVAFQVQALVVVTLIVTVPPVAVKARLKFATVYAQGVAPACVMVILLPAIVSVPLREAVLVLAVNEKFTVPLPVPLVGETVIQLWLSLAVQRQFAPEAVTATLPVAAAAGNEVEPNDNVNEQPL